MASFRKAVRYFTPLWGGALNFIAVEDESGGWDERTRQCIGLSDFDLLTVTGADGQARRDRVSKLWDPIDPKRGMEEYEELEAPVYPEMSIFVGADHQQLPSGETFPSWLAAARGEPNPNSPDGPPVGLGYIGALINDWSPLQGSPLARGARYVSANWTWPRTHGLVLVPIPDPEALNEIALFWNLRAALWPFGQWIGVLPLFDADLRPPRFRSQAFQLLAELPEDERSILLVDIGQSMTEARQRLDALLHDEPADLPETGRYGSGPIDVPVEVGFPRMPGLPGRLSNASSHQLPSRLPNAIAVSLVPPHANEGACVVDVLAADPRLKLPPREAVGALVHPRGRLIRDGVAVLIQPTIDHAVTLNIPGDAQVVEAVLNDRGLTHERSNGGEWADQLLQSLGGDLAEMPLRAPAAMGVVRLLAPQRDERLGQMNVARLPAEDLQVGQIRDRLRATGVVSENDIRAVPAAVATLARTRIVFAGMRVRCPSCGLQPWRVVDDLATQMQCSGCRAPIAFDGFAADSTAAARWSYRLNSAFDSVINQGAAAVLLSLARLRDDDPESFRYSTGRNIHGLSRTEIEVDGIVCIGSNVGVLEARSSGQIDENDIAKTLEVADAIDATAYFATLDQWQSPGAELLQRAAAEHKSPLGVPRVRLFAGDDLVLHT